MAKKSQAAQASSAPPPTPPPQKERAVIIDGVRTPFVKAFAEFQHLTAVDLAQTATRELLQRVAIDPKEIDEVILGCVLPSVAAPNVAREVVLGLDLPPHIPGMTVARACASSAQAVILAAQGILVGDYKAVIAGGVESMSNVPIPYSKNAIDTLMGVSKAPSVGAKVKLLGNLKARDLLPRSPDIAEASTGKSMGQHAEMMAQTNGISRQAQDELALASHQHAAAAWESGKYSEEVCTVWPPPRYGPVTRDTYVRGDTTLEKLSTLKPAFERKYGTLTAGNSSGLTDGASAVLVMAESRAREMNLKPLAAIRSWANSALSPKEQLLLGPAYAIPKALDKAGLTLAEMDLIEIHEAFAAQVLSVVQALESDDFARKELGKDQAVGKVDREKLNVNGGSIALGHPFGATGTRILLTLARELERRKARYGLVSLCAAGGMGTTVILERLEA